MDYNETRYQENGFELSVYKNRKADPYTLCQNCERPLHHVASILDEWAESQSSLIHYHYCKHCNTITQKTIQYGVDKPMDRTNVFEQPPHELLVELLAISRQQNGRGVSLMMINKQWWSPKQYPLFVGHELGSDAPRVRPIPISGQEDSPYLDDEATPNVLPMPRYNPPAESKRNPFTSRGRNAEDDGDENSDTENTTPTE